MLLPRTRLNLQVTYFILQSRSCTSTEGRIQCKKNLQHTQGRRREVSQSFCNICFVWLRRTEACRELQFSPVIFWWGTTELKYSMELLNLGEPKECYHPEYLKPMLYRRIYILRYSIIDVRSHIVSQRGYNFAHNTNML